MEREYIACDCLALVSHTENFGATVVDAMAHGKPVVTSDKTPWREVVEHKCGWWVSNAPAKLSAVICEMMAMSDDELRKVISEVYAANEKLDAEISRDAKRQ